MFLLFFIILYNNIHIHIKIYELYTYFKADRPPPYIYYKYIEDLFGFDLQYPNQSINQ